MRLFGPANHRQPALEAWWVTIHCALLLFVMRADSLGIAPYGDEMSYYIPYLWSVAHNGIFRVADIAPLKSHLPAFVWLSALILNFTGWKILSIRIITLLSTAFSIACVYLVSTLYTRRTTAMAVALVALFSPVVWSEATQFHSDLLAAALVLLSVYFLVTGRQRASAWVFAAGLATNTLAGFFFPAFLCAKTPKTTSPFRFLLPSLAVGTAWLLYVVGYFSRVTSSARFDTSDFFFLQADWGALERERLMQIFVADGRWIQSLLVAGGLILFYGRGARSAPKRVLPSGMGVLASLLLIQLIYTSLILSHPHQRYFQLSVCVLAILAGTAFEFLCTEFFRNSVIIRRLLPLTGLLLIAGFEYRAWLGPCTTESPAETRASYGLQAGGVRRAIEKLKARNDDPLVLVDREFLGLTLTHASSPYVNSPIRTRTVDSADELREVLRTEKGPYLWLQDEAPPPAIENILESRFAPCESWSDGCHLPRIQLCAENLGH